MCFSAAVSLEEVANALKPVPEDAAAELAASYAHRQQEFLRCARDIGWVGNPDEDVSAFGECYRRLTKELTKGEIVLMPNILTNRGARMVEFEPWVPKGDHFKPSHKLNKGYVDVRIKGHTLQELRERLDYLKAKARCPKGWEAAAQDKSKYPVLRYRVGVIHGHLSADAFDAVSHIIVEALHALSDLRSWWKQEGARLLPMSP